MWCASRGARGACLAPRGGALARRSAGGARAPCRSRGSACAPRALFGIGQKSGASSGQTLADIEAEIDAAAPASSTAATAQLSLADAVWKVSKETPMSLRDRAACAIAAEAVQALCETGLERASLVVTLALAEALRRNGFESEGVRTVAGYLVSDDDEAVAHCWLEVDGARPDRPRRPHARIPSTVEFAPAPARGPPPARLVPSPTLKPNRIPPKAHLPTNPTRIFPSSSGRVLDVVTDGMALCEAARRARVDYSDAAAVRSRFGDAAIALGDHRPDRRRPLVVLGVPVPVGGTRTRTVKPTFTLRDPPIDVAGAAEARTLRERYESVLRSGRDADALAAEMPPDAEEVFRRVAGVALETVGDARARAQRLAGAQ